MNALVIVGPTASGKSMLGLRLAERIGGEIVSIDSRQIYRGLDIGTAKPSLAERERIRHHLIDILDINRRADAEWFARSARNAITAIASRARMPILVGGSGLYLRAVMHGLFSLDIEAERREKFAQEIADIPTVDLHRKLASIDPASHARIHVNDRYRIVRALEVHALTGVTLSKHFERGPASGGGDGIRYAVFGIHMPRPMLKKRIIERAEAMYEAGWPAEVRGLLEAGADPEWPGMKTLGYPEMVAHVSGRLDGARAVERIVLLTAQYAKRQVTWFRKTRVSAWIDATREDPLEFIVETLGRDPQDA